MNRDGFYGSLWERFLQNRSNRNCRQLPRLCNLQIMINNLREINNDQTLFGNPGNIPLSSSKYLLLSKGLIGNFLIYPHVLGKIIRGFQESQDDLFTNQTQVFGTMTQNLAGQPREYWWHHERLIRRDPILENVLLKGWDNAWLTSTRYSEWW